MKKNRLHVWLCLPLSVMMTSGALSAAWGKADYYTLKAHGKPIGQVSIEHFPISTAQSGQSEGAITEIHNTNRATREGTPFALNEVSRFVETLQDGHPLSFSYAYNLGEQHLLEANGKLNGSALDMSLQRENTLSQGKASIAPERFLFPAGEGMHQIYRQHFLDPQGSRFEFQTLSLGLQPQIVNSEVTPGRREKIRLGNGKRHTVREFEIKNPANPTTSFTEWRDAQGKLYKAQSSDGDELELILAAIDDNGDSRDNARLDTLDVVTASAVVSNKIAQPRITTEALYRLSPIHGQSIDLGSAIPAGDRQTIQKLTDNQLYLKVIQQQPQDASLEFPIAGPSVYLQSTPYVQANDPDIDRLALATVGREKRAYFAARMLQKWVYEHIAQKDLALGFASAKDTLLNREGDCTEHAVLLTALTRALGIPSRVAVGLVYLPNGNSQAGRFVYHMWTEIYLGNNENGEWVPLDATQPMPMTDATHIKLADSALSDASDLVSLTQRVTDVMGRMKIDVLKAMSLSQSVLNLDSVTDITATALHKVDLQEIDIQSLSRKAIQHYRVELAPAAMSRESSEGLFTYGVEALSKGRYEEAVNDFRQAMDKEQRHPLALYRLGERLAGIEMYDLAKEAFQQAADKDPALNRLANAWSRNLIPRQTLPDELNQQFMQAITEPGQASNATILKAITAQASYFAPAYRHLGEETTGTEAINALQQAAALAPNDFRNQESLGDALMAQGRFSAAGQAYRNAAEALKQNPAFLQSKPDWLLNLAGRQALAQGSQMVAHNKYNATGWLTMGKGLLQQKRRQEAAQAFSNAIALSPGNGEAQILNFQMALQNADWKSIYAHKDTIAGLSGGNALAASLLGLYQMHSRQYGPAVSSLQHAIAMAPGQGEAYRTLAQTYLRMADLADDRPGAQGLAQSKRLMAQAQATLRRGSKSANTAMERHSLALQLGRLLIKSNQPEEAEQLANAVLADNPIDGAAWAVKGKAQFYAGQIAEARRTLGTALILNPNDADTLVQLGHVAKEEAKDALALEFYQKAYKADPFSQEASDSVRSVMKQLHIVGQQPPNYWFLSDDEHDYLIQLLYQSRSLSKQTLNYLRALKTIPGRAGKVEFSAKGIEAAQQLRAMLERQRQSSTQLRQSLQNNWVPARFATLNDNLEAAVTNQIAALNAGMLVGSILDFSSPKVPPQTYAKLLFSINQPQKSIDNLLTLLDNHLPDPVLDGLMAEAQLDDLYDIQQESAAITRELVSRKEKSTTMARSGPGKAIHGNPIMAGGISGIPTPTMKGNNTGMLAPSLPTGGLQNMPMPPGFSPNAIKNISLPGGLPPAAINSFSKPATGP